MKKKRNFSEQFSNWATAATGSSVAFIIATLVIVIWQLIIKYTGVAFTYNLTLVSEN